MHERTSTILFSSRRRSSLCAILRPVSCLSPLHAVAIAPDLKAEVTVLQTDKQSLDLMKAGKKIVMLFI